VRVAFKKFNPKVERARERDGFLYIYFLPDWLHIYDQQVSLCNAHKSWKIAGTKSLLSPALTHSQADKGNSFQMLKTKCSSLGANISIAFRRRARYEKTCFFNGCGRRTKRVYTHTHRQWFNHFYTLPWAEIQTKKASLTIVLRAHSPLSRQTLTLQV
jgi:hypothetical protein